MDNTIKVASIILQVDGSRFFFMQSRRYPAELIIEKRYINIRDVKFTEEELPKEVVRVRNECYNYWYNSDEDAAIYVVTHDGKYGVFANLQAV